jgi:hypothetical protein
MPETLKSMASLFAPSSLVLLLEKEWLCSAYGYEFVILPVLLNIIKIAPTDNRPVDTSNLGLILNSLHCVDCLRRRKKFIAALFVLASIVSFPSISISLNEPLYVF